MCTRWQLALACVPLVAACPLIVNNFGQRSPDAAAVDGAGMIDGAGNTDGAGGDAATLALAHSAVDILFIIDNSGSMAEEQLNLARNASSSGDAASACDSAGFAELKQYVAAHRDLDRAQWEERFQILFDACGFIERLQLFEVDFHIGVISTDTNDCDRPLQGVGSRGSVPQRGCLQSGAEDPSLTVLTPETPALAAKFADIVTNVGTHGSAYEKGLEAARLFLTPGHAVADSAQCELRRDCSGDLEAFLRATAVDAEGHAGEVPLLLVFLTDEDDCSHGGAIDETQFGNTELCYSAPEMLLPIDAFATFFRGLKSSPERVSTLLIAGLYAGGSGLLPSGCVLRGATPSDDCDPAHGNSVAVCDTCFEGQPICACHPAVTCDGQSFPATNCCQADPAARYHELAQLMASYRLDTVCSANYKSTLVEMADQITGY